MTAYGPAPEDEETPGLAGERTGLAWSRSGLAVVACVAAVGKRLLDQFDHVRGSALVFALLAGAGVAWAAALLHARVVAAGTLAGARHADPARLRAVAYGTAALGAGAAVLAWFPAG